MDADSQQLRVVVVTMDSHMATAMARAEAELQRELPGLTIAVHAADEWSHDPKLLAACHEDIANGDIVVATMLFLDDHIRDVLPALTARRDTCDAMVCCVSAKEVVRLTRIGKVDMTVEATGAMAMLKKLRPKGKAGKPASSGERQMRMLRRLPRLLRFIPGAAQDMRAYFLSMQYWLAGSEQNLANMVRLLAERYAAGPRSVAAGTFQPVQPIEFPDVGVYHPDLAGRITDDSARLPSPPDCAPIGTVGILVMRSYVIAGNTMHYDGVIAALEARGLRVIPAFSSGLDQRPAIARYFTRDGASCVDTVLSLTGFSLVGGPAYNDSKAAQETLAKLDVPYIAAASLEFQTIEQWQGDSRGFTPVEATMMVAIPELDGGIMPTIIGGKSRDNAGEHRRDMVGHMERAATLAARIERMVRLRRVARADRKLAVVLFNFPPNAGSTGTAAYLDVFASLHNTLTTLRASGYTLDVPATPEELREIVTIGNAARYGALANVAARIPADDHIRDERYLRDIEAQWGPAPGRHQSDGSHIHVLGAQFGNIFVGVQPSFGYEGDPMRLMFEGSFAPTHAFSAFYRWMERDFGAHALLHFGTHGALEFMPGKQAGLSAECWPDRLIGNLPNFYFYASNNPSEGMLAKRRAGATLLSYITPPIANAGLYRGLADLKSSLDRLRALDPQTDAENCEPLVALVQAQAAAVDLADAEPLWTDTAQAHIERLTAAILELEYTLIPHGLHIIGAPPNAEARAQMLDAAAITDPQRRAELDALLSQDHEIPALIHALDGGFIRPAPGGDFLRTPEIVPTGRNLHGFDPFLIPSAFAVEDGARQADRLLARHAADGKGLPETVALVLWGTDNLKTEGGPIAQVLWLLGCAPKHDGYGRLVGPQLIPLAELGRPRVDVVVTLSGIFRDLLPLQTKLLAQAALMVAEADEPLEMNAVRRHALAFQIEHGGTLANAALRVFGNADSAYGANVNSLLESGAWNDEDELAEAYVRRKGFAYGVDGRPQRQDALLAHVLGNVDVAYQNLDSIELGVTTVDHYFDTLGGVSRAIQQPARQGGGRPSISVTKPAAPVPCAVLPSRWLLKPAPARSTRNGMSPSLLTVSKVFARSKRRSPIPSAGPPPRARWQPWVYQQLTQTFMLDDTMRTRLAELNPTASAKHRQPFDRSQ